MTSLLNVLNVQTEILLCVRGNDLCVKLSKTSIALYYTILDFLSEVYHAQN